MEHYRADNTEGYEPSELAELNAAWRKIIVLTKECDTPALDAFDYYSETLLEQYDMGKRGRSLVAWFYRTGGI